MPGRRDRDLRVPSKLLKGKKMPKMKTKSSAKKRFRVTATGKIKFGSARKRHGMSKRPHKMVRTARGSQILDERDAKIVRNHLPYDL
jgi:large subunit ribosomal protein L35